MWIPGTFFKYVVYAFSSLQKEAGKYISYVYQDVRFYMFFPPVYEYVRWLRSKSAAAATYCDGSCCIAVALSSRRDADRALVTFIRPGFIFFAVSCLKLFRRPALGRKLDVWAAICTKALYLSALDNLGLS